MREADGHVEEWLDRYRTGELPASERHRVEGHLEACEGCRTALAALEALATTVERGYAAETAARAAEGEPDWGRLRAAIVARTSARRPARRRSWLARHVPQAAAAGVALVALGVLWQQGVRGPADAERALRSERPAASRVDRAGDRSGGPAAETRREGDDRPDPGDRFAGTAASEEAAATKADAPVDLRKTEGADPGIVADEVGAAREGPGRAAARAPAPAAQAVGEDAEREDAANLEDRTMNRGRYEARQDSAVAAEPELANELAVTAQQNAAAPPPELERFQKHARVALAEADSVLAAGALAQWRDSLASGDELPADLRRAAEALADSLAVFLATRP